MTPRNEPRSNEALRHHRYPKRPATARTGGTTLRRLARTGLIALLTTLVGMSLAQGVSELLPDWLPITFIAEMTDDQVVPLGDAPAVESGGSGTVIAVLTGNRLVMTGSFRDLEGSISLGVIVFRGVPGENGRAVRFELVPGVTSPANDEVLILPLERGAGSGTTSAVFELQDDQVQELMGGLYHVQALTTAFPSGELRGQLTPVTSLAEVEVAPGARLATAEDLVGAWRVEGEEYGWQIYGDGHWTYLGTMAEIGETPDDDRTWTARDGISTAYNHRFVGPNCAGGPYVFLDVILPDGRLDRLELQGPEGCVARGGWIRLVPVER